VKSSATINPEVAVLAELNSVGLARVAERDGRPEEALSTMLGIVDPEGTHVFPIGAAAVQWLSDVVRLAQAVGRLDIGAAAARAADREVCLRPTPATRAAARHCRGLIEANPEEVRTAARLYESVGAPLLQAAALEDAAVLDADRGDAVIARVTYLAAVDIYRELGATWDVMRVDARLRPYNIRRGARGSRRRSALGWEAFTPAEERIAVLVAAGQSNATIATRLLLSRHTVESHVSHILRKLNATSRIEIAQAAARRHSEISHRHRPSVGFPLLDAAG